MPSLANRVGRLERKSVPKPPPVRFFLVTSAEDAHRQAAERGLAPGEYSYILLVGVKPGQAAA